MVDLKYLRILCSGDSAMHVALNDAPLRPSPWGPRLKDKITSGNYSQ